MRIADRWLKQGAERAAAMIGHKARPSVDRTRHADCMGGGRFDFRNSCLAIPLGGGCFRRSARTVKCYHAAVPWPDQGETVAADSSRHRLDHALHGDSGDSGIHRISAAPQHLNGGCGGQRIGCSRHAAPRHDRRTPRQFEIAHVSFLPGRAAARIAPLDLYTDHRKGMRGQVLRGH